MPNKQTPDDSGLIQPVHPLLPQRFQTRVVKVGSVPIGGSNPIVLQSMTTVDTMDTEAVIEQSIQLYQAGSQIVRITAPGPRDAANLARIKSGLLERGFDFPLVADIHFAPRAAMIAIEHVEKVRINPGNFCDSKKFKSQSYSDSEYAAELERIRETFAPLVIRARELGRVLRIGSNHGSLSDRIMNRYGDTPLGMVESAMEYLRIAVDLDFFDIVISMKASNPQVMVQAYRQLVQQMKAEQMDFPLHLGVTEAGMGADGRLKSATGIGTLLLDGLGDTIRVSLTEDPVHELQPARLIAALPARQAKTLLVGPVELNQLTAFFYQQVPPAEYRRLTTRALPIDLVSIGNGEPVLVFASGSDTTKTTRLDDGLDGIVYHLSESNWAAELTDLSMNAHAAHSPGLRIPALNYRWLNTVGDFATTLPGKVSMIQFRIDWADLSGFTSSDWARDWKQALTRMDALCKTSWIYLDLKHWPAKSSAERQPDLGEMLLAFLQELQGRLPAAVSLADTQNSRLVWRLFTALAARHQLDLPALILVADSEKQEDFLYSIAAETGSLLLDGIGDALFFESQALGTRILNQIMLNQLQACRLRFSKTEYISCPSCGRTLFDLEETTTMIQQRTGHLKNVKIAVMGCIVNGPGEMADADFGYVGAGPGKIHLYRQHDLVKNNIPSAEAVDELIKLIKEHGMWREPASNVELTASNSQGQ
ncbi:MAG: (E)-4-hydroxy-3-methylbut-2-enyl-diphosphate synthase [Leptospiraceae bacterium]|nr:(E)-4-hydroxy-3-methylbut-2-enyl-diphosphate synthase [Leptospiraceae bacterium]